MVATRVPRVKGGRAMASSKEASERIRLKRAYDAPAEDDGARVLVERLWPRGVRKDDAALDDWLKEVAPSPELRKWYAHDTDRWDEFKVRYLRELEDRDEARAAVEQLLDLVRSGTLTLVLASKDVERSSAALLKQHLDAKLQ